MSASEFKLKFSANLSTMFLEVDNLEDRYFAAKKSGFSFVECQLPYDVNPTVLVEAQRKAMINHVLINSYPGDPEDKTFGMACVPGFEAQFIHSMHRSLIYATPLNCKYIHVLAGMIDENFQLSDQQKIYEHNLQVAADMLEEHCKIALIEPMCTQVKPGYFLNCFENAVESIKKVDNESVKLLLDVFHLHMIYPEKNVLDLVKEYYPYAAHIQISQAPGRQEPDYDGEINYDEILQYLYEQKYSGCIGLEYTPSGKTEDSLSWLKKWM